MGMGQRHRLFAGTPALDRAGSGKLNRVTLAVVVAVARDRLPHATVAGALLVFLVQDAPEHCSLDVVKPEDSWPFDPLGAIAFAGTAASATEVRPAARITQQCGAS